MSRATKKLGLRTASKIRSTESVNSPEEKYVKLPVKEHEEIRKVLINRTENIILSIIRQVCTGKFPKVSYSVPTYEMVQERLESFDNDISHSEYSSADRSFPLHGLDHQIERHTEELLPEETDEEASGSREGTTTTVNFASERSKNKLALMITILARSHYLMITRSTRTRRSLYYDLQGGLTAGLAPEQRYVDQAVNHVASLLKCSPWDLGFVATSKGLVAGNLVLSLIDHEEVIDCNVPGGTSIPQVISNIATLRTSVDYVILVEKDAVFQILLEEDCPRILNCLLVTGKGYPDVATRVLVKLLSEKLKLPIYAFVDADPFGVEIMCIYRYGSAALSREHQSLVCPAVRWLGIHPSELTVLGVPLTPLTNADISKLMTLEGRPYTNGSLSKELNTMKRGKAEIEAIASFSQRFLTMIYLPSKIKSGDYF